MDSPGITKNRSTTIGSCPFNHACVFSPANKIDSYNHDFHLKTSKVFYRQNASRQLSIRKHLWKANIIIQEA